MQPETRYARCGDLHIAYQIVGDGPLDLVFVPSWFSHVELLWQEPNQEQVLKRLASFSRLIIFDNRGTGLSDPVPLADPPTLEERMDDVLAVMDAAGCRRAAIFGAAYGGQLAAVLAGTHPERTSALVLYNTAARYLRADDYPLGAPPELPDRLAKQVSDLWGRPGSVDWMPGANERLRQWLPTYQRMAMSPGAAASLWRTNMRTDVRDVLPSIRVPTLVIHRSANPVVSAAHGRYLAEHIEGAKYVEVPGVDQLWFVEDTNPVIDEIEEFLTGMPPVREQNRVLATVLFTDIVSSTAVAAELGDLEWRNVLEAHEDLLRRQVERFQGRIVKTTGDGILATFDGPARAIRSAVAIRGAVRNLGLEVRAGLHTGEIELFGDDVAGIGVHIASRVMATARDGEVAVSSTVKDLVVGSGISFEERGPHELKGIPGEWRIFAVKE